MSILLISQSMTHSEKTVNAIWNSLKVNILKLNIQLFCKKILSGVNKNIFKCHIYRKCESGMDFSIEPDIRTSHSN